MQNQTTIPKRYVAIGALVIAIIVLTAATLVRGTQKASVTLVNNLDDTSGLSITYNGKEGKATQELSPGDYTVALNKAGYDTFSKKFTINGGDHLLISAQLAPKKAPEIKTAADAGLGSDFGDGTVESVQYFYDNTWAVVIIQFPEERDVTVSRFDPAGNQWITAIDPGVLFTSYDIGSLPALVQGYLADNNYVGQVD